MGLRAEVTLGGMRSLTIREFLRPARRKYALLASGFALFAALGGPVLAEKSSWPGGVQEIRFTSSGDQSEQPALFLAAKAGEPRPLIVFLHQWGGDHRYAGGVPVAVWCAAKNWNFLQPDFRGPNKRPEALGSELVLADIASAIEYAKAHGNVDSSRVFLLGASGGGHAALLTAGRMPGVFRGVSAWVPITDLIAWHAQCLGTHHSRYARDIEAACGGNPVAGSEAEKEAKKRSPLSHLAAGTGTAFDINAGIHDGHDAAAVPISHSFRAYNALAEAKDRVPEEVITMMTREQKVPGGEEFSGTDAAYGTNVVLFRRESPNVRLTIFEGGHKLVAPAALEWLEKVAAVSPGG